MQSVCLFGGAGTPVTSGGVEALLSNGDQVVGVDGLHVDRHLLHPLLKGKSTSRAAQSMKKVRRLSAGQCSRCTTASTPLQPWTDTSLLARVSAQRGLKRLRAAGRCAPAGLVDEVPVEDGGVVLVEAPVDGVAAVREGVQVRLIHLAALPVGVEVVLARGGGRPVDVPVDGQPVVLHACRHSLA